MSTSAEQVKAFIAQQVKALLDENIKEGRKVEQIGRLSPEQLEYLDTREDYKTPDELRLAEVFEEEIIPSEEAFADDDHPEIIIVQKAQAPKKKVEIPTEEDFKEYKEQLFKRIDPRFNFSEKEKDQIFKEYLKINIRLLLGGYTQYTEKALESSFLKDKVQQIKRLQYEDKLGGETRAYHPIVHKMLLEDVVEMKKTQFKIESESVERIIENTPLLNEEKIRDRLKKGKQTPPLEEDEQIVNDYQTLARAFLTCMEGKKDPDYTKILNEVLLDTSATILPKAFIYADYSLEEQNAAFIFNAAHKFNREHPESPLCLVQNIVLCSQGGTSDLVQEAILMNHLATLHIIDDVLEDKTKSDIRNEVFLQYRNFLSKSQGGFFHQWNGSVAERAKNIQKNITLSPSVAQKASLTIEDPQEHQKTFMTNAKIALAHYLQGAFKESSHTITYQALSLFLQSPYIGSGGIAAVNTQVALLNFLSLTRATRMTLLQEGLPDSAQMLASKLDGVEQNIYFGSSEDITTAMEKLYAEMKDPAFATLVYSQLKTTSHSGKKEPINISAPLPIANQAQVGSGAAIALWGLAGAGLGGSTGGVIVLLTAFIGVALPVFIPIVILVGLTVLGAAVGCGIGAGIEHNKKPVQEVSEQILNSDIGKIEGNALGGLGGNKLELKPEEEPQNISTNSLWQKDPDKLEPLDDKNEFKSPGQNNT